MSRRVQSKEAKTTLRRCLWLIAVLTPIIALTVASGMRTRMISNERQVQQLMVVVGKHARHFHDARFLDADGDRRAEYGWLQQIGGLELIPDPDLPAVMRIVERTDAVEELARAVVLGRGVATFSGYRIAMFLPLEKGWEVEKVSPEMAAALTGLGRFPIAGRAAGEREVKLALKRERGFTMLAWPIDPRKSGRNVYMVNEEWTLERVKVDDLEEFSHDPSFILDPDIVRAAPAARLATIEPMR